MKSLARPRTAAMRLSLAALLSLPSFVTSAGEDGSIRLAIGPFFAPPSQESLRQASGWIPELLTADLSHSTDLVLVEREKVQAVCRELQLSSASLVDKATVANL